MNNYSGKSLSSSMPHSYALGTTAARLSRFEPPTHAHDDGYPSPELAVASQYCPRVLSESYQCHLRSQYPSFTQPRSRDHISHSPSRSPPRSRHTQDPSSSNMGYLSIRSTPTACSAKDPFSKSKKTEPHKTELRPELTAKKFDDLGFPHVDLRYQLPESIVILGEHRFDLKQPSVTSVRIISQAFPWNIDITKSRKHGNITWKDMLEGLYNGLHKKIEDYEWSLLMLDRDPQYKVDIETIANTRINDPDRTPRNNWPIMKHGDKGLSKTNDWSMKRIDCLGHRTAFLGFKQDRYLEEMRRMPNSELPISEVWVAELGASERRGGRGRRN